MRDQLCEQISVHISRGILKPGMRLPSCRKTASQLGVSRNTVVSAYQILIYDEMVEARDRSGYFVHKSARGSMPHRLSSRATREERSGGDLFDRLGPSMRPASFQIIPRPDNWMKYPFPFVCNQIDAARFPLANWRKCSSQVLSRSKTGLVTSDYLYQDCEELTSQIRTRLLPRRGIFADEDELLLTAGAQQAIYLTAMIFGGKGRRMAIEDPCYPDARNIFDLFFGDVRPVSVDGEGIVCDDRLSGCDLVYVTPNHQFPTSVRLSRPRRAELLDQAERQNIIILEDDYDCETDFDTDAPRALRAGAPHDRVIYVGSLSKSLSPGLRLGYMVAPSDFIQEARALRGMMIRHPSPFIQLTAARFIRLGHHDALLSKLKSIYEQRWYVADAALKRFFPEASVTSGWGGTNFLVAAPSHANLEHLVGQALEAGVVMDPIKPCFMHPEKGANRFRIGVSAIGVKKIATGLERLRTVYDRLG